MTVQDALKAGKVNLYDPGVTLTLLKLNAVVGTKATLNQNGSINRMGLTCAIAIRRSITRSGPGSATDSTGGRTGT